MNRILASALALTLTASVATVAQQQAPANAAPASATQTAPAQADHHKRSHDPHKMAVRMSKKLGLTQDQTAKVEPILADRQQKMDALKNDTSLTPEQKRAQLRSIAQDSRTQLAGVLTPDQLNQLKSSRHNHKADQTPAQPNNL